MRRKPFGWFWVRFFILFGLFIFSVDHRDPLLAFHRATTTGRCLEVPTPSSSTMAWAYTVNGRSYTQKRSGIKGWGAYHSGDPVRVWYFPEFPQISVWGNSDPAGNAAVLLIFVLLVSSIASALIFFGLRAKKISDSDPISYDG